MNWQQRSGQIYTYFQEQGKRSLGAVAAATGFAKSSVHRHMQALKRRQQYPESPLWEHQRGHEWLHRLVWAVVYVFGVKRGIGNETLSEFFHKRAFRAAYRCFPQCRTGDTSTNRAADSSLSLRSNRRN